MAVELQNFIWKEKRLVQVHTRSFYNTSVLPKIP